jgi:hypothetical protein
MILSMPFQRNIKVKFEPQSGSHMQISTVENASGNLHQVDGHSVALYALDGQLYLQIDTKIWPFSAQQLKLSYHHKVPQQQTHFALSSPTGDFAIDYPAWWANIPDFELVEPEMDKDEDYLAYIYEVWQTPSIQQTLLKRWTA